MLNRILILLVFNILVNQQGESFAQQYCEQGVYGSGCNPNDNIHAVSISNTSLNVSGNYCTNQFSLNVTVFPDTGSATCNLVQGQSYQLNVISTASSAIGFWIDYNHNFLFEASEYQQVVANSVANVASSNQFMVQTYPYFGKTRMRIRTRSSAFGSTDACTPFGTGETEDYTVFIVANAICSNPISPGSTVSLAGDSLCYGSQTILSLQGNTIAGAISYHWESSSDSISWNPLPGGAGFYDTIFNYASTFYRCAQTCSGITSYSTPLHLKMKSIFNCYCASAPSVSAALNKDSHIGNVKISNLNNGNDSVNFNVPLASGTYSDFTNLAPGNLVQGATYPIRVVVVNNATNNFRNSLLSGFIDFNQNGIFEEPYEKIINEASIAGKYIFLNNITIPFTAALGLTKMRIIVYNEEYYKQGACFAYNKGETEDYLVSIQPGTPCTSPVLAGNTMASLGPLACEGNTSLFTLVGGSQGASQTYQWQFSHDSLNWFNVPGEILSKFQDSLFDSNYYRCQVTCGVSTDYSVPYKITLLPSSQCYCASASSISRYYGSSIGKFSFGNLSFGVDTIPMLNNPTSKDVYSNNINLPLVNFSRGSSYMARVKQITSNSLFNMATARIFLDFNRDGLYSWATESQVIGTTSNSGAGSSVSATIAIPATAQIGITGLRIMLMEGSTTTSSCGGFFTGEVEDYLIYIDFATQTAGIQPEFKVSIYPNPVNDMATISYQNKSNTPIEMHICNLNGMVQNSYRLPVNQSVFNFSTEVFAPGLYLVEFVDKGIRTKVIKLSIVR